MNFLIATFLSLAILFLWGGICFLYFQFRYGGSEEQKRAFLQSHYSVLTFSYDGDKQEATSAIIKKAGNRGWSTVALPIPLMSFDFAFWSILLSIGLLFFGGLFFSYSWFGLRCLESLGLKSFPGNGGLKPLAWPGHSSGVATDFEPTGLPFDVSIPNDETIKAMEDSRKGRNLERFDSTL